MCSVTHVAAGALIGGFIDSRIAAFVLGVGSHIPLDMVPHIDFEDYRVDGLMTAALLAGILAMTGLSPVFFGALGAVAPDLENLLWKTGIIREDQKIFPTHSGLIGHGRAKAARRVRTEILVGAGSAGLALIAVLISGGLR
jgi:hypothetical protein